MAWAIYQNGNAITRINLSNGTKIRETEDDEFRLEFPENIDVCIGKKCDGGCKFCYECATPDGPEAELLHWKFLDTMHPYTEIAINGNSIDHEQIVPFLELLSKKRVLANMTVNQIHFERKEDLIADLINRNLIHGLGISLRNPTPEFIEKVKKYPNAVIHTINGILTKEQCDTLANNDLKLLILGYKDKGRGVDYINQYYDEVETNMRWLYDELPTLADKFAVVSFDNLSLDQLNAKRLVSPERYDELYQGDEGSCSMYIDLVSGKFGVSSLCDESEMHPIMDDIKEMFHQVQIDAGLR